MKELIIMIVMCWIFYIIGYSVSPKTRVVYENPRARVIYLCRVLPITWAFIK